MGLLMLCIALLLTATGPAQPVRAQTLPSGLDTAAASFLQVSAGDGYTCVVNNFQRLVCWGGNWDGRIAVPAYLGPVHQVSTGSFRTCALTKAGSLRCWGRESATQYAVPSDLGQVSQVSQGSNYTCVVTITGSVCCWDDNEWAQSHIPIDPLSSLPSLIYLPVMS